MEIILDLQNVIDSKQIPDLSNMKKWISATLENLNANFNQPEVTIRVVSLAESQELNHQYRDKNQPTNVLSFPFEVPEMIPVEDFAEFLGDLVICEDIIVQEAKEQKKSLESHWAHMIIHGLLHLVGFDHITAKDAEEMEGIEVKVLAELGFANPY